MLTCIRILSITFALSFILGAQSGPTKGTMVDTEVVELGPNGFFPKQIIRTSPGKHFLYVRNTTTLRTLTLVVTRQDGPTVNTIKQRALTTASPHWNELLDLTAGTYTLTEVNHPSWTCQIVIKPGK